MQWQTAISQLIVHTDMQPSKRPSLPSPSSRNTSHHPSQRQIEPLLDSQRIEKYIQFIKMTLKSRLRDKNFTFQQNELKEMHKLVKAIQHYHSKSQKDSQGTLAQLRIQAEMLKAEHDSAVESLKIQLRGEMEEKERKWSQQLLAINNDNGRKQQAYKQTIEKLMNALASAQKSHQQLHLKLNSQMQSVTRVLKALSASQRRDHFLSNAIRDLVQEINLRQQNSLISSKSGGQLSLQQIDLPISCPPAEEPDSCLALDISQTCLQKQLQAWLIRLICFGLFDKENQDCLKKIISFTKGYQQPTELLQQKVFPVVMEMLTANMMRHQQRAWRYLQGSSGIRQCWQGSRIQLRNVSNLSELEINNGWDVPVMDSARGDDNKKSKFF